MAAEHDKLIRRLRSLSDEDSTRVRNAGGYEAFAANAEAIENAHRLAAHIKMLAERDPTERDDTESASIGDAWEKGRGKVLDGAVVPRDLAEFVTHKQARAFKRERDAAQPIVGKALSEAGLQSLIDKWIATSHSLSQRNISKAQTCLRRFIDHVGDFLPRAVTAAHARQFRDWLEVQPNLSLSSAQKHMHALSRLFVVGLSEGLVDSNPFHGIKVRKAAKASPERRKPFEPAQVRAIFAALAGESDDFRLIVRLLAYHGLRSGEAAQLRCEDITTSMGAPVIRVHGKHGSIKNKVSERDVPVHPAMRAELKGHIAKLDGQGWLFPSFPTWRASRSEPFQRKAGPSFLRTRVKITDPSLTMHSLRHTWRTLAREINMPEPVSRAIMGHRLGKDDHAFYGGPPSLKMRAKWMRKIDPLA